MAATPSDVIDLRDSRATRASKRFTISVVIPALDEEHGLRWLLPRIPDIVDELIVVDGGSRDGSVAVVAELAPDAIVLEQQGRGKGNALKLGLAHARGEILVTMDADGSMDPADIVGAVDALIEGHDFVKGSRELPGAGSADFTPIRRAGNQFLTSVCNRIYGPRYTDITYGFNAYWRTVMVDCDALSDGFEFEIQAAVRAARAGLRTAEVPCFEAARIGGASKLHAVRDGCRILRVIVGETHPRRAIKFRAAADLHLAAFPAPAVPVLEVSV